MVHKIHKIHEIRAAADDLQPYLDPQAFQNLQHPGANLTLFPILPPSNSSG